MLNQTQRDWVKGRLVANGKITRNECLREYISRLGAIICDLKKDGWDFDTSYVKVESKYGWTGKDYVYKLKRKGA